MPKFLIYSCFSFIVALLISHDSLLAAPQEKAMSQPELERIRQSLPDKALTVDYVVTGALKNSDSFQAVKSELYSVPAQEWQAKANFDTQLKLSKSWLRNENEPNNNFQSNKVYNDAFSASLSRNFSTGTTANVEVSQGYNDIGFPSGSPISIDPYYETKASLNVSQKLWSDSFGYASRRALHAAQLATEANKMGFHSSIENWTLSIVSSFYQAWLTQTQTLAAIEGLKRRERLLKATKIRLDRGTAERPDYLQVESAFLLSRARRLEAQKNLDDHWRRLIVLLKLPAEWMTVDPIEVPLKLDDIAPQALNLCQEFRKKGVPDGEPATLAQSRLLHESAVLNWERAKNESWPNLSLTGSYFLNGIDGQASTSQSETLDRDHPGWSLGLVLTMPFEFHLQRAQVGEATTIKMQAEAKINQAKDEQNLTWLNECSNLERLDETVKDAQKAFENQTRRADLEERRFRLGRSSTFNVIQAGDDATDAEVFLHSTEIQFRESAWRILQLENKILARLKDFVKKHGGQIPPLE